MKMASVPIGTRVAGRPYDPEAVFWRGWSLVDTFADQTGSRKAELISHHVIMYMRADVSLWLDGIETVDPTATQLLSMVSMRDYLTVAVNVSKADSDGTKFGPNLISLLYNPNNAMSFAAAWRDYELAFPLRGAARRTTPLFTTDGAHPWSATAVDNTLRGVMAATLTPAQRRGKTFHSKRVWLATALSDLHSSDGEIQALVRWSSVESLRIYARMNMEYQARRRDLAHTAVVNVINATHRVQIDDTPEDLERLEAMADALEQEP